MRRMVGGIGPSRASTDSVAWGLLASLGNGIRYTMVPLPGSIQMHLMNLLSICLRSFGDEFSRNLDRSEVNCRMFSGFASTAVSWSSSLEISDFLDMRSASVARSGFYSAAEVIYCVRTRLEGFHDASLPPLQI